MENRYKLIGWTAILSSVFMLPKLGGTSLLAPFIEDYNILLIFIGLFHAVWFLCQAIIYYHFKHLLIDRCNFTKANRVLSLLIINDIILFIVSILVLLPGMSFTMLQVSMILFFPHCILLIILGFFLRKIEVDLFGLLKPYAYIIITSGILGLTVFLTSFGITLMIVSLIMLGVIFLRCKEHVEFV